MNSFSKEKNYILIDFGSTFTKAALISSKEKAVIYSTKTPSTVSEDAGIGLNICYERIRGEVGSAIFNSARKLATSSAAGGLRMIVVGLTYNQSVLAGKNAACCAGARIINTYGGLLTEADIAHIDSSDAEIILMCGGYEDGNKTGVIHNAKMLGLLRNNIPVIYSGNGSVITEVRTNMTARGKTCYVIDNIIPRLNEVNSAPAVELIREIFMKRIVNMKGLDSIRTELDEVVMPTPMAVLKAGELLSYGTDKYAGLGELMIVDVGGATTDVYSYSEPVVLNNAKYVGVPEPYSKRTVEGDLGMRESALNVISEIGYEVAAESIGINADLLNKSINMRVENKKFLPEECNAFEKEIDHYIASKAVHIASRRHAGHIEAVHSSVCKQIQYGKDLSDISLVIGTGGQIVNSQKPYEILGEVAISEVDEKVNRLMPVSCELKIDSDYILYAAGLLSRIDPDTAFSVICKSINKEPIYNSMHK